MPLGIDRRLVYNVDWVLVGTALLLSFLGVAMIYSATHTGGSPDLSLRSSLSPLSTIMTLCALNTITTSRSCCSITTTTQTRNLIRKCLYQIPNLRPTSLSSSL